MLLNLLLHLAAWKLSQVVVDGRRMHVVADQKGYAKCSHRNNDWDAEADAPYVAVASLRPAKLVAWDEPFVGCNGSVYVENFELGGPTQVSVSVWGLEAGSSHGLFILQGGLHGCNWPRRLSTHYNPTNESHGSSESCWRHVGDLDPVEADGDGVGEQQTLDRKLQLLGPANVIGRSVAVLLRPEDNEEEAGERLCCGVLGHAAKTQFATAIFSRPEPRDGWMTKAFLGLCLAAGLLLLLICVFRHCLRPLFEKEEMGSRGVHRVLRGKAKRRAASFN